MRRYSQVGKYQSKEVFVSSKTIMIVLIVLVLFALYKGWVASSSVGYNA